MTTTDTPTTIVRDITINAPAAKIFAALTEPDQLVQWWGDDATYHTTHMERDLRVGGAWRTDGVGRDGEPFFVYGVYRAVDAPRLLEYTWRYSWADVPDAETIVRFELAERDGVTQLRLIHSGFADATAREQHEIGWTTVFGWLSNFVESR